MGKVIGPFSNFKGSIGDLTFYQKNGQTIVRKKGSGATSTTKSAKQLLVRSQWNNIINAWKSLIGDGPEQHHLYGRVYGHRLGRWRLRRRLVAVDGPDCNKRKGEPERPVLLLYQ